MIVDRLVRVITPPPAMPALPDLRTIEAPPGLRLIRGFDAAWTSALAQVQTRVSAWAAGAWDLLTRGYFAVAREAVLLGLHVGLVAGLLVGAIAVVFVLKVRR